MKASITSAGKIAFYKNSLNLYRFCSVILKGSNIFRNSLVDLRDSETFLKVNPLGKKGDREDEVIRVFPTQGLALPYVILVTNPLEAMLRH